MEGFWIIFLSGMKQSRLIFIRFIAVQVKSTQKMKQMERIKCIEEQRNKLKNNQEHVIEAISNLNDRFWAIEGIIDVGQLKDAKNIWERQAMIDELIVKNSDELIVKHSSRMEEEKHWSYSKYGPGNQNCQRHGNRNRG